ncbi:MAG: ABC transporter substrate-binding protein [Rhodospirillaceae bacterium]|nr:MAG: ABC transporter substrate-binding protein [Rhodospirillaceae bacterium]
MTSSWHLPTFSLSRRQALRLTAGAGAALALPALTLSAGKAQADTPKRGGRLILGSGQGSTTDTTDPALLVNGFQWLLAFAYSNTLTEILPDGSIGPVLAESWDSKDAKTWHFKLRRGVSFHNGKTMTPADVVASLNYHRGETSKSFVKPIADLFDTVKADGEDLIIVLKSPNADLPASLNTPGFTIFPADGDSIDWKSRIGTGGYTIAEHQPGVRTLLKRDPNYWRDDRAFADEVELLTIADSATRMNALITGQVMAIEGIDPKTVELIKQSPGITIDEAAGPLHYDFPMRTDKAPFTDNNVRQSIKHALDRQDLLDRILLGHGHIGNDTPIGPSYRYFAKDLPQATYDPEKARFLLKKAGMDGLKIDLSASDAAFASAVDAALLFQQHAAKAGININVRREPSDGYWDDVWMKKPFSVCYWGGYPTEGEMFALGYAPKAPWNDTYWTEEKFESLRQEAIAELDEAKRKSMYDDMQKILNEQGGALIPCFANYIMGRNASVGHGPIASNNSFDGRRAVERWWVV